MLTSTRALFLLVAALALANSGAAFAQTPSPAGAKVYFVNLKDGAEVDSPFLVQFGLSGMGVAPAGVEKPNTGHHHLLIDAAMTDEDMKGAIPMDDTHKHFGNGRFNSCLGIGRTFRTRRRSCHRQYPSRCADVIAPAPDAPGLAKGMVLYWPLLLAGGVVGAGARGCIGVPMPVVPGPGVTLRGALPVVVVAGGALLAVLSLTPRPPAIRNIAIRAITAMPAIQPQVPATLFSRRPTESLNFE
jgi:hypothetical protein